MEDGRSEGRTNAQRSTFNAERSRSGFAGRSAERSRSERCYQDILSTQIQERRTRFSLPALSTLCGLGDKPPDGFTGGNGENGGRRTDGFTRRSRRQRRFRSTEDWDTNCTNKHELRSGFDRGFNGLRGLRRDSNDLPQRRRDLRGRTAKEPGARPLPVLCLGAQRLLGVTKLPEGITPRSPACAGQGKDRAEDG
jgi:hypothetical protein